MVARAVALVEVAVAAEMQQIEFVDQAVAFQKIERAIDGYARDVFVDFLSAVEDFVGVQVAAGGFHDLQDDAALFGQADTFGAEGLLQVAGSFVVDALAGGDSMDGCGRHLVTATV